MGRVREKYDEDEEEVVAETERTVGNAYSGRLLYTCYRLDSAKRKLDRLAPAAFNSTTCTAHESIPSHTKP